eukprot:2525297-Pyramimonas_sp.AAC.1
MAATAQPGTMSRCSRREVPCGRTIPTPPARPPVGRGSRGRPLPAASEVSHAPAAKPRKAAPWGGVECLYHIVERAVTAHAVPCGLSPGDCV